MSSSWLDEWTESIATGQANMNMADWKPLNIWLLEPYFGDWWVEKWLRAAEKVENGEIEEIEVKQFCYSIVPSLWRKELRFLMWSSKIWGYDEEKRLKLANFLKKILAEVYTEDNFGLKSNKPRAHPLVEKLRGMEFHKADEKTAREIGRLSSSCPALSWSLYTDFYYSNNFEMFGLYDVDKEFGNGSSLLVKKFGHYRCPELWKESAGFKYNDIVVAGVYKNLNGYFDIINHFVTTDSMAQKMTHYAVLVDGEEVTAVDELREVQSYLAQVAGEQFLRLENLNFEAVKRKCIEAKTYQFKEFFVCLGEDWLPSKEIFERLNGKKLDQFIFPQMQTREDRMAFWKNVANPRVELSKEVQNQWKKWRKSL